MDGHAAVDWLLRSDEPAIRFLTRRDVLGERSTRDEAGILDGPKMQALLSGQQPDGGFGRDTYRKWTGAHWRLISLAELAAPPADPRVRAVAKRVLTWVVNQGRYHGRTTVIDGLARVHACIDGNALGALCRLGFGQDERVRIMAESLIAWQWPDGGWNCDPRATGRRSSFHESLPTAWGLHEYAQVTGDTAAREAANRAAELFLEHRLLYRLDTGKPIDSRWLQLRYPSYWHYDLLQSLLLLARMGKAKDARTGDALDLLERRRRPDGRWAAASQWWNPPDSNLTPEVVDWGGRSEPNEMITLNALRVFRAAGRLTTPAA
ncbi:MAG: hypothetical protein L0Y54_03080 [Sporichthyaceae bacterium]|nr:hypothetical protein [Sporichthyaceae bacterium]